jgi:hypothetical protein
MPGTSPTGTRGVGLSCSVFGADFGDTLEKTARPSSKTRAVGGSSRQGTLKAFARSAQNHVRPASDSAVRGSSAQPAADAQPAAAALPAGTAANQGVLACVTHLIL